MYVYILYVLYKWESFLNLEKLLKNYFLQLYYIPIVL